MRYLVSFLLAMYFQIACEANYGVSDSSSASTSTQSVLSLSSDVSDFSSDLRVESDSDDSLQSGSDTDFSSSPSSRSDSAASSVYVLSDGSSVDLPFNRFPFGTIYDLGERRIVYVALNPEHTMENYDLLEKLIRSQKPQVILLQGHFGEGIHRYVAKFKYRTKRIVLKDYSAARKRVVKRLAQNDISETDYECYRVICHMNHTRQYGYYKGIYNAAMAAKEYLKSNIYAKKLDIELSVVKKWFRQRTGSALSGSVIGAKDLITAKNPALPTTTFLQKIAYYEGEVEDIFALETLTRALPDYDRVMYIRHISKYKSEKPFIDKMVGVTAPPTLSGSSSRGDSPPRARLTD